MKIPVFLLDDSYIEKFQFLFQGCFQVIICQQELEILKIWEDVPSILLNFRFFRNKVSPSTRLYDCCLCQSIFLIKGGYVTI